MTNSSYKKDYITLDKRSEQVRILEFLLLEDDQYF